MVQNYIYPIIQTISFAMRATVCPDDPIKNSTSTTLTFLLTTTSSTTSSCRRVHLTVFSRAGRALYDRSTLSARNSKRTRKTCRHS